MKFENLNKTKLQNMSLFEYLSIDPRILTKISETNLMNSWFIPKIKTDEKLVTQEIVHKVCIIGSITSRIILNLKSPLIRSPIGTPNNDAIKYMLDMLTIITVDLNGKKPICGLGGFKWDYRNIYGGYGSQRGYNEFTAFFKALSKFNFPFSLPSNPKNEDLSSTFSHYILSGFIRKFHYLRFVNIQEDTGLLQKFDNDLYYKYKYELSIKERDNEHVISAVDYLFSKRKLKAGGKLLMGFIFENWGNIPYQAPEIYEIYKNFVNVYTSFRGKISDRKTQWRLFLVSHDLSPSSEIIRKNCIEKLIFMDNFDQFMYIMPNWEKIYPNFDFESYTYNSKEYRIFNSVVKGKSFHYIYTPTKDLYWRFPTLINNFNGKLGMVIDYDRCSKLITGSYKALNDIEVLLMQLDINLQSILFGVNMDCALQNMDSLINWIIDNSYNINNDNHWIKYRNQCILRFPHSKKHLISFDASFVKLFHSFNNFTDLFSRGLRNFGEFEAIDRIKIKLQSYDYNNVILDAERSFSRFDSKWEKQFFISILDTIGKFEFENQSEQSGEIIVNINRKYSFIINNIFSGSEIYEKILPANQEHRPSLLKMNYPNDYNNIFNKLKDDEKKIFQKFALNYFMSSKGKNFKKNLRVLHRISQRYLTISPSREEVIRKTRSIIHDMFASYNWTLKDRYGSISFFPGESLVKLISLKHHVNINSGESISHDMYFFGFFLELSQYRHDRLNYSNLFQGLDYVDSKIFSSIIGKLRGRPMIFVTPGGSTKAYYNNYINMKGADSIVLKDFEVILIVKMLKKTADLVFQSGLTQKQADLILEKFDLVEFLRGENAFNNAIKRAKDIGIVSKSVLKKLKKLSWEDSYCLIESFGNKSISMKDFKMNVVAQFKPEIDDSIYHEDCIIRYKLSKCMNKAEFDEINHKYLRGRGYNLSFKVPNSGDRYLCLYNGSNPVYFGQIAKFNSEGELDMENGNNYKLVDRGINSADCYWCIKLSSFDDLEKYNWSFQFNRIVFG